MVAVLLLLAAPVAEPEYAGQPLSVWAKRLKDDDTPRRRRAAALALAQIGTAHPESLTELLPALGAAARRDASPEVRRQAAAGIGQQSPDAAASAVPDLTEALRAEQEPTVRRELVAALGRFGPAAARAVGPLTDALADQPAAAALALGRIGAASSSAAPKLLARLADADVEVRREVVTALGLVKPAETATVAAALVKLLPPADDGFRLVVLTALGRLGDTTPPTLSAVAGELAHKTVAVRVTAAQTLGRFGPAARPNSDRLMAAFRDDPNGKVREAVARSLALILSVETAVPLFAEALSSDRAVEVRVAIAELLGGFGTAAGAAVPALRRAQGDAEPIVRQTATEALRRIETKAP